MKPIRIMWLVFLFALIYPLLMPISTFANSNNPTPNTTAINQSNVWRNALVTGDIFVTALYNVSYNGTNPSDDISQTFVFRLMDANNSIELGSVEAYPYLDNGYGLGVVAWYFAPGSLADMSWGQNYWIKLEGKQTAFANPPIVNFQIPSNSFSSATSPSDVQNSIGVAIIGMAQKLGNAWGQAIIQATDSGSTILTTVGMDYFNTAIPGIHAMAPGIFLIGTYNPDYSANAYNTTQGSFYDSRLKGTDYGNAIQGVADLFSVDFNVVSSLPILILCVVALILSAIAGNPNTGGNGATNILSGFVNCSLIITAGAWVGLFPSIPMAIITFLSAGFIIYHLAWKNS